MSDLTLTPEALAEMERCARKAQGPHGWVRVGEYLIKNADNDVPLLVISVPTNVLALISAYRAQEERIKAQDKRISELEEGLRPFAAVANSILTEGLKDHERPTGAAVAQMGFLRRAAALLSSEGGGEP